jgi:hypothetical protein
MTSGKIKDNIDDEKGIKSALASFLKFFFSKMERESTGELPKISSFVEEMLKQLRELESNKVNSIDAPADVFGNLMAGLLAHGFEGEKRAIAEHIGKRIGRWTYIVDAFDDYEDDRKSGSYNPFVLLYDGADFTDDDLLSISKMLEAELAMALSAIDLLDEDADKNRAEIIKNILCLGMPASVQRVIKKKNEKRNR